MQSDFSQPHSSLSQLYSSLEFDRVLEKISSYASSALGAEGVSETHPFSDIDSLQLRLKQVSQMMEMLRYDDPFPIHGPNAFKSIKNP